MINYAAFSARTFVIANFGKFDRAKHVYVNEAFTELIKDALRFFHGTPILPLPLAEPFVGAGVYAIYCTARTGMQCAR